MSTDTPVSAKQNDALLWLSGAVIAGIGITWLIIASPWSLHSETQQVPAAVTTAPAAAKTPISGDAAGAAAKGEVRTSPQTSLEDKPLRMAELAYQAGMLVEPENYSAWSLYRQVLAKQPDNAEARQGLEKIATELLRRANAAVQQGRYDDARKTVERIREALPGNSGAMALDALIAKLTPKPAPPAPAPSEKLAAAKAAKANAAKPKTAAPASSAPKAVKPAAPKVDKVAEAEQAFASALAANRLIAPVSSSAKHFLGVLSAAAPDDKRTLKARGQLFDALLQHAAQSLADKDTDAAATWIKEAGVLNVDAGRVATARRKLDDQLIKIESARRLPISNFKVVKFSPPTYPQRALNRGISGWVDVEFTVARDGTTKNIVVTDAENESYFKAAAVDAVSHWRFKPRVFMNQPIDQRTYMHINFNIKGPSN